MMASHEVHSIFTVLLFISFIMLIFWAYNPKQKLDFDEAARLPLDSDEHEKNQHK